MLDTYVIGNSIVRELLNLLWETICLPGADWHEVIMYIWIRRERFRNSLIYIHIGPVRFTEIRPLGAGKECWLRTQRSRDYPENLLRRWVDRLSPFNVNIVLCTLYPADFERYNRHLGVQDRRRHDRHYGRFTDQIKRMTVCENRRIIDFNVSNGFLSPYMHRKVFTRRRGAYVFRDRLLRDGLHPVTSVVEDWESEIRRVNVTNWEIILRRRQRRLRHR